MHTVSLEGQGDALAPVRCMLGVPQAARMLGIGRTLAYELVRTGEWPTPVVRVGRLIKIPSGPLVELLATGRALGSDVAGIATRD